MDMAKKATRRGGWPTMAAETRNGEPQLRKKWPPSPAASTAWLKTRASPHKKEATLQYLEGIK